MASGTLNFEKVLVLPTTYAPNTIYLVKDPSSTEYISFYISDELGETIYKLPDTKTINKYFYSNFNSQFLILATLEDMYNTQMTEGLIGMAWVLSTDGDPNTNGLPAPYIFVPSGTSGNWFCLFNINYLANNINWNWIQGAPQSTPQEIDAMVAWWRSNSTTLNEIENNWNEIVTETQENSLFIYENEEALLQIETYFADYGYFSDYGSATAYGAYF